MRLACLAAFEREEKGSFRRERNARGAHPSLFSRAQNPHSLFFQTPATQAKARLISNAVIEQAIYKFASRFCLLNKSIIT